MMTWASLSGIQVPEIDLVEIASMSGLPEGFESMPGRAFVVKRFDRDGDRRIHIEDFAQVLDRRPTREGKYSGANYETVANIIYRLGGFEDLAEFVRRIVAMTAMGNGDAHLKNFSLIYPDGKNARLSPAYDLVSTAPYVPGDSLALNFGKSKIFTEVSITSFRRLAVRLGLPSEYDLDPTVKEVVTLLRDQWSSIKSDLPADKAVLDGITERLKFIPIFS
jgi:serine/threonine-protein kinase HipA